MQTRNYSERIAAFLLLTLMLFAFAFSGMIAFIHAEGHDYTKHCSPEIESDACHIAVFHPDLESGCTHKTHVFEGDAQCFYCHLFLPDITPIYLNSDSILYDHIFKETGQSVYQVCIKDCPTYFQLRAPPVCT